MSLAVIRPLITPCITLLTFILFTQSADAQSNVGYRVQWLEQMMPAEWTGIAVYELNVSASSDVALVVGYHTRSDRPGIHGFIYDHLGFIDPDFTYADSDPASPIYDPNNDNSPYVGRFWDIHELVGPSAPSWAPTQNESSFRGVNASGRLCGYLRTANGGNLLGFYFDLNSEHEELQQIPPTSATALEFFGRRVNETGDILLFGHSNGSWGEPEIAIYNPDTVPPEKIDVPVPVHYSSSVAEIYFNSSRQVLGVFPGTVPWSGSTYGGGVFRHTVVDTDNDGISDGVTEEFLELTQPGGINDYSQFSAVRTIAIPRNKRQTNYQHYAARIGVEGSVEWDTGSGTWNRAGDLNNSGDMLHEFDFTTEATNYLFHEGDPGTVGDEEAFLNVIDLIIGGGVAGGDATEFRQLSDRDHTGFGWIYGRTDTNGDGLLNEAILLIPEAAGETPGITVSTTAGLSTTEAGGQASFDVSLDTQPIDDVMIGISSSDTTEGIVAVTSLTFTSANWNVPQTVTITGQDDPDIDGDIAYTIVTAAATSTDPAYNGFDADDVSVINEDDDGPAGGTETYTSTDPPQGIPDDNTGVAISTVNVSDSLQVISQTVTLDISHPRPSDLQVFLTGPDPGDATIELFNYSGDNDVTGLFSGTQGDWVIEVYDTRKKKTGTLNGWSITIEY